MKHYSVLLNECIEHLDIKPEGQYIDGTLGRAGHSMQIVKKLNENGHLYCFDKDMQAINESKERLNDYLDRITFIHSDFSKMKEKMNEIGISEVDGVLLDIGVSSPQFDDEERGFSYRFNARLDMRMDQSQTLSAYEVVNFYTYQELVSIFYRYGEESFAKQIARKIEQARLLKPIESTFDLVEVIKSALPAKVLSKKGHPAKKVFQAIRIEVNQELSALENGLEGAVSLMKKEGRICVITFHSLEDRIVKNYFNQIGKAEKIDKNIPILPQDMPQADFEVISKKPILPSTEELTENQRSHSAKLRVIKKK